MLERRKSDDDRIDRLDEKVRKRRSTSVRTKPPLEPIDLVLSCELLFDEAKELSQPSVRETIDRMRRVAKGKPIFN